MMVNSVIDGVLQSHGLIIEYSPGLNCILNSVIKNSDEHGVSLLNSYLQVNKSKIFGNGDSGFHSIANVSSHIIDLSLIYNNSYADVYAQYNYFPHFIRAGTSLM